MSQPHSGHYVEGPVQETVYCAVCGGIPTWHPGGAEYEAAKARGYTPRADHGAFVPGTVSRVRPLVWVMGQDGRSPADAYRPGTNNGD